MAKDFDDLKCGNCGYDGGKTHMKEVLNLNNELTKFKLSNTEGEESLLYKRLFRTIAVVIVTIIFSTTYYQLNSPDTIYIKNTPITYLEAVSQSYDAVSKDYNKCLSSAGNQDGRNYCAKKLGELQQILLTKLEVTRTVKCDEQSDVKPEILDPDLDPAAK